MIPIKYVTVVFVISYAPLIGTPGKSSAAGLLTIVNASDSTNVKETSSADRLKLSGSFQGELRWSRDVVRRPSADRTTSDLYLRRVEIALESSLAENVTSTVVLNSEWLNDFVNAGDQQIAIDEVHIDLQGSRAGPYAIFGKKSQPFGAFENQLISDPMAKDAYETNKVGLTVGLQAGAAFDASLTLYKGTELMNHLFQSRLLDTSRVMRVPDSVTQVGSWIASGTFSTVDSSLTLMAALLSEPGLDRRNVSVQVATNIVVPSAKNISVDAEYIKAVRRERYFVADREFREGVIGVTLAYSFVYRPSQFTRRGLYRARRLFTRSHPFTTALRYEYFHDDGIATFFSSRVIRNRYSLAGRYTILERVGTIAYVGAELNRTTFGVPTGASDPEVDHSDTFLARFGVDF